ncbi:hypothetical protein T265_06300 [Opisthorchis viverrini]|uniref:Uncharacterized protein n=1 Tax=Opisthorchis viverrini TaxID=6198 RepID=A0A074ZGW3_OPIVI|nr:hypothetical protein T265_06300 [Opisthorchis viverrini]KER26443.1 hypothetical protein T265_06300 [Opisthorchis viverrini]
MEETQKASSARRLFQLVRATRPREPQVSETNHPTAGTNNFVTTRCHSSGTCSLSRAPNDGSVRFAPCFASSNCASPGADTLRQLEISLQASTPSLSGCSHSEENKSTSCSCSHWARLTLMSAVYQKQEFKMQAHCVCPAIHRPLRQDMQGLRKDPCLDVGPFTELGNPTAKLGGQTNPRSAPSCLHSATLPDPCLTRYPMIVASARYVW